MNLVTVSKKKEFFRWLLEKYELKEKEVLWLINYLMSDERLLSKIHFTNHFGNLPKTILISTSCVDTTPFMFYKNNRVYYDVEAAFHDIRLNPNEDVYISVFFKDRASSPEYESVLEGSPMEKQNLIRENMMSLFAEIVLDKSLREFRKKQLRQEIDYVLDQGDKEKFLQLSEELKMLNEFDRQL